MPIILMQDVDHAVLMALGEMRDKGICFPSFDTISREMPELNIARLSDSLEKLRWKGMIGEDDRQFRLTGKGIEEYQNFKRAGIP